MTFPTIPTVGAGRILTQNQANATSPRTFPSLTNLTKNDGDLLIAIVIAYQTGTGTNAAFSSWGGGFTEFHDSATSTTMAIGAAYKWSDGTETGTFTVAQAGTITGHATMILLSIPGAHTTTPPEAGGRNSSVTTTMANAASFNPTAWDVEDTLWIAVGGDGETSLSGTYTGISAGPANYTTDVQTGITGDAVGGVEGAVAFRQNAAAAEDAGAWSADTTNSRHAAITIAVRPRPAPNEGSAAGAVDWAGSATGARGAAGAATGTVTWAGAATGARVSKGAAAGTVAWAGSSTGAQPPHDGSASGTITWAGAATGAKRSGGAAAGAVAWVGSATGAVAHRGAAAGAVVWAGSATGAKQSTGAAAGTVAWAGSATGAKASGGAASGAVEWSGSAVGQQPASSSGDATGAVTWAGAATGAHTTYSPWSNMVTLSFAALPNEGTAAGTITWAGAATGRKPSGGAAAGTITWAGTAAGASTHKGSAAGAVTWAGSATGQRHPSGAATGTITWAGAATGQAPVVGANEGAADGTVTWAGAATGATTRRGAAVGAIGWAGSTTGITYRAGSASGTIVWAGVATGISAASIVITPGPHASGPDYPGHSVTPDTEEFTVTGTTPEGHAGPTMSQRHTARGTP